MEITLIRHTSVCVPQGVCYGQTDVPLNDTFEQEAAITAAQLVGTPFDTVYTSPLSRCVRLATYCGYANALRDDRIKELNFGDWEMQPFDKIEDTRLQEWFDDHINVQATNGESFRMQFERVSSFLAELKHHPYKHVAIFAHGGVLIAAQLYAGTLQIEDAFKALTPFGGVIQIHI